MNVAETEEKAIVEIFQSKTSADLEKTRVTYLGRNGVINQLLAEIPELPRQEDRKQAGALINAVKNKIEEAIAKKDRELRQRSLKSIGRQLFDVTAPGERANIGTTHPLTQFREFVRDSFTKLGFEEVYAPHLESDEYNFSLLNIPPDHPSRDIWDTLYLEDGRALRTHTSNMQVREMRKRKPPIRVMTFDRCFRYENIDPYHSHTFTQFELLYVDRNVSMGHLRFLSNLFLKLVLGEKTQTRFRPKYYPFVEPGVGVDALCPFCEGPGCQVCGMEGWFEIAGAGLVHPQVLRNGGIDPKEHSGLAWGFGPDRMLMIKQGIEDLRHFYEGDLRFLKQF